MGLHQPNSFGTAKATINRLKREHIELEKNLCQSFLWQRTNIQYNNQFFGWKINNQRTSNPISKWANDLNTNFSKEELRIAINIFKNSQHIQSPEKCISKLYWDSLMLDGYIVIIMITINSNKCWWRREEKGAFINTASGNLN